MAHRRLRKPVKIAIGIVAVGIVGITAISLNSNKIAEVMNLQISKADEYITTEDEEPVTLEEWQQINNEVIWMLTFNDDDIVHSIPVVYTENGDHYMRHNLYGEYDSMGSVFMEAQDSPLESVNWIINGHSSKTKNWAFTFMKHYADPDYFNNHSTFTLEDADGLHTYKVLSFGEYDVSDEFFDGWYQSAFRSHQDVVDMLNDTTANLINHVDHFTYRGQQLMTLITCDMNEDDTRYVLTAYEV